MITSYGQLTGKYLKANKKRALLTIIGIILSVALISTIGLFFKSIQDAQIEDAKNTYGSFHLVFSKTNDDLVSKVVNNPKVARSGFYAIGEKSTVGNDLVVTQIIATDKALELLPCKAKQGRLPENESEVAIEKWVLNNINKNAKIGDKIKFNNKEYTLVGILEDIIENQIDRKGILLSKNNEISKKNSVLLVEINSRTNLKAAVSELKGLGEKESVMENTYLLMMEGAGSSDSGITGLYVTLGIIIGIVIIATIAVIYNSFQISVVERIKQFGLLRAVGSTPKQIRKIVLREATILAAIGIPLGLLCGIIAIYGISFAFKFIGGDSVFSVKPVISPAIMAISGAVGLASIYISALIPAFFAGRISPLVAISSRTSITKEKIKKRSSKIIQKLFGFEGALAFKNIKRNRKRYRITVFSIVISVVLFVTFKSFMDMTLTIGKTTNESKNVHFSIIKTASEAKLGNKLINDIESIGTVDKVYKIYNALSFDTAINKSSEVKEIQDMKGIYRRATINNIEKTLIRGSIVVYDNDSLESSKKYLKSGSIQIDNLNKENGVILINKNRIRNGNTKKDYFGPVANLKVGDEINLQASNTSKDRVEFGKGNIKKAKIMAIVENEPLDFRGSQDSLKIITTEQVAKNLTGSNDISPVNLNILIKNVKDEETAKTQIESVIQSNTSLKLINNIDQNRRQKTSTLMVQILIYGFVVVVSLIGSVNIINTLTTNIILRKREFAALKSIGLTHKGLKKMIVLEGLLYGVVGTIYGSIIGCGLSYLMYKGLGGVREFGWSMPWNAIAIAGVAAIIIGYMSVLSPLSRIKKENIIEAVREDF